MNVSIDLLVNNYNEFSEVGGFFSSMEIKRGSAFSLALKGVKANSKLINEAIEVIKKNTSGFSNFRGNIMYVVATTISLEENMESAFLEIKAIYKNLKEKFSSSEYLVLTAIAIFNAKDRVNSTEVIKKSSDIYDLMKKDHWFLTGEEDTVAAAMVAINSNDIEKKMKDTQVYYNRLKEKGYWSGNSLQSLSHILVLFDGDIDENIEKVVTMDKILRENNIKIKSTTLPLLAVSAFLTSHPKDFAQEVRRVDDELKVIKGFKNISMGSEIRNMMSVGLVAVNYSNDLENDTKDSVVNATSAIILTIEIAMEMAVMAGVIAASAASSASS